jgi:DNA repair exonuclease SbcCD nuclease subunit
MKKAVPKVKVLAVGDIHFHKDAKLQGDELIERIFAIAEETKPTIVVLLGDILDTHETVKNVPWKQAERLFEGLSKIYPTYVLIGNHDLCSASEFLTDNHFFGPFKQWPNITIVDKPIQVVVKNQRFVMCPYVPPGRFVEALNTLFDLEEPIDWREADCIFAHQEFHGVVYNNKESQKADQWSDELPLVISGHIHQECEIGENVKYVGSSRQVKFNETPDKKVWCISFSSGNIDIQKIEVGLKAKKEIEIDYDDLSSFDFDECESYYIKLKIHGSSEQFKLFRKHPLHAKMLRHGIKINFVATPLEDSIAKKTMKDVKERLGGLEITFEHILCELVKSKRQSVQDAYAEVYVDD